MAPRVILLDALGTLLELEPPVPRLLALLRERHGLDVELDAAALALRSEMRHYRDNCIAASDEAALEQLRLECASIIARELGAPALDPRELVPTLLESIAFAPYAEVPDTLARWHGEGRRLVVASNWDISLHDVLERTGLREHIDAVATSAEVGAAKPDPALFTAALALVDAQPQDALHIGDQLEEDVEGARAAGIEGVWLRREATEAAAPDGIRVIASLDEL
jgi:putative hydrolase of the HAD superfamily